MTAEAIAIAIQTLSSLFGGGGNGGGELRQDAFKQYMDVVVNQIMHPQFLHLDRQNKQTVDVIYNITNDILTRIDGGLSGGNRTADDNLQAILNAIYNSTNSVNSTSRSIEQILLGQIANVISSNSNAVNRSETSILGKLGQGVKDIVSSIFCIEQTISDDIGSVTFGIDSILEILKDGINNNISNIINIPSDIFDNLSGNIRSAIESVSNDYLDVIQSTVVEPNDLFRLSLDEGNKIAGNQAADVRRQTMIMEEELKADKTAERYWIPNGEDFSPLKLFEDVTKWIGGALFDADKKARDDVTRLLGDGFLPDRAESDCRGPDNSPGILPAIGGSLFNWFISLIAAGAIPLAMGSVRANRNVQNYRMCFPDQLMPEGDIINSIRRGSITPTAAKVELRKHGFTTKTADSIIGFAFEYPPLDLLYALYLREDITEDQFDDGIKALGFFGDWAKAIKKQAFFIPPPQDLITMAVREVFNEPLARANGQFDDYPQDFGKYASQQGISEEWAKRYWAAHWRLPSELMGFEMLHRGIIDDTKLDQLLVALDIMPGWRDEIKAISYNTLTRVDVRRMHAMGVLDDTQTKKAYKDMGYNDSDADLMVRFTKEYNDGESVVDIDIASDLTRSTILGFYKDRIINRESTFALLIQAGINAVAAELFLQDSDLDAERKLRQDQIDIVMTSFEVGRYTFVQATDAMRALNLSNEELELQLLALEKKAIGKNTLPSKQDLLTFVKGGFITADEFITVMEKLGFDPFWSNLYLKTVIGGGVENES